MLIHQLEKALAAWFFNAEAQRVQRDAEKNELTRTVNGLVTGNLCALCVFLCASALK